MAIKFLIPIFPAKDKNVKNNAQEAQESILKPKWYNVHGSQRNGIETQVTSKIVRNLLKSEKKVGQ